VAAPRRVVAHHHSHSHIHHPMKPSTAALILAAVAALLSIVIQTARLDRAQTAADTLVASRDSTRLLSLKLAWLGDSMAVVERRAVQVDQRADALDRALGVERAARDSVVASIASYRGVVRSDTVVVSVADPAGEAGRLLAAAPGQAGLDSIRQGTFDLRQAPYTVHATVALPVPPERGTMEIGIDLDTLWLEVRLGCGAPNGSGVRAATAIVSGPSWAGIQLGRVEQAPGVCNAAAVRDGSGPVRRALSRVGVSVGYVAGVTNQGKIFAGPGVIFGVRLWP